MMCRVVIDRAMKRIFAALAPMLFLLAGSALAASRESVTFVGLPLESAGACTTSENETCPTATCTCLVARGSASGQLTGLGYGEVNMTLGDQPTSGCQPFNASLFVIAPKELQELDFSGAVCLRHPAAAQRWNAKAPPQIFHVSASFVIAISQGAHQGSGTVSGRYVPGLAKPVLTLHFSGPITDSTSARLEK